VSPGFVIALVGAESTGKSTLASGLRDGLVADGHDAVLVTEALREFCDRQGRTPRQDDQAAIAAEQSRRIALAASEHAIVVTDTTALMIAVYSDWVFGDRSLYPSAEADHARSDLTLLTGLDLPWQADGHQRDGPQVRGPVDARVRAALDRIACRYSVVCGLGPARLQAARAAVDRALFGLVAHAPSLPWRWSCARCDEAPQTHDPSAG
jgi:nicotinamide riboside kinase